MTGTGLRVAVAGGTGVAGRHVVAALSAAGHEPVVLARSTGVDVTTGAGLAAALDGADAVVDVSGVQTLRRRTAVGFFEATTRALLAIGVPHLVVLSIVGIDDVDSGYYAGKRRQEHLALHGPSTVLRATQFHEFAGQVMARSGVGPLRMVPQMRVQPVAAVEVGAALAELAVGPPRGRVDDLAGPEVQELPDLARRVLRARRASGRVVALGPPGALGRALAGGGLLPGPGARLGTVTFDDWLATAG
jgi:uncharacterized protein YbjT (DUF2867 family)